MRTRTKKIFASSLSLLMLVDGFVTQAAETNFWKQRQNAVQLAASSISLSQNPANYSAINSDLLPLKKIKVEEERRRMVIPGSFQTLVESLPYELGSIRRVSHPSSGPSGKVVVLLQDVHMNADAQRSISNVAKNLSERKLLDLIALEGTSEDVDLASVRASANPNVVESVADFLLAINKISGAIHGGLIASTAPQRIQGVETPALYHENVQAYLDATPYAAISQRQLHDMERLLLKNIAQVGNQTLLRFISRRQLYQQQQISMASYLTSLSAVTPLPPLLSRFVVAAALESSLDYKRIEEERASLLSALMTTLSPVETKELFTQSVAYRASAASAGDFYNYLSALTRRKKINLARFPALGNYIRYVLAADGLNGEDLFDELQRFEGKLTQQLAQSAQEKSLMSQISFNGYLQKLTNFSLSANEWEQYQRLKLSVAMPPLDHVAFFEKFYLVAHERDSAMTQNLIQAMHHAEGRVGNPTLHSALLVVGGFHAQGMISRLNSAGFTTISFVPRISKVTSAEGSAYLSVFSQDKTPLEKLVMGEKLFLAFDPKAGFTIFPTVENAVQQWQARPRSPIKIVMNSPRGAVNASFEMKPNPAKKQPVPIIVSMDVSKPYWSFWSILLRIKDVLNNRFFKRDRKSRQRVLSVDGLELRPAMSAPVYAPAIMANAQPEVESQLTVAPVQQVAAKPTVKISITKRNAQPLTVTTDKKTKTRQGLWGWVESVEDFFDKKILGSEPRRNQRQVILNPEYLGDRQLMSGPGTVGLNLPAALVGQFSTQEKLSTENGHVTRYERTNPAGGSTIVEINYDSVGRPDTAHTSIIDANGSALDETIQYLYGADGREIGFKGPGVTAVDQYIAGDERVAGVVITDDASGQVIEHIFNFYDVPETKRQLDYIQRRIDGIDVSPDDQVAMGLEPSQTRYGPVDGVPDIIMTPVFEGSAIAVGRQVEEVNVNQSSQQTLVANAKITVTGYSGDIVHAQVDFEKTAMRPGSFATYSIIDETGNVLFTESSVTPPVAHLDLSGIKSHTLTLKVNAKDSDGTEVTSQKNKTVAPLTTHEKFVLSPDGAIIALDATNSIVPPGREAHYVVMDVDGHILFEYTGTEKPVVTFDAKALSAGSLLTLTITIKGDDGKDTSDSNTDILIAGVENNYSDQNSNNNNVRKHHDSEVSSIDFPEIQAPKGNGGSHNGHQRTHTASPHRHSTSVAQAIKAIFSLATSRVGAGYAQEGNKEPVPESPELPEQIAVEPMPVQNEIPPVPVEQVAAVTSVHVQAPETIPEVVTVAASDDGEVGERPLGELPDFLKTSDDSSVDSSRSPYLLAGIIFLLYVSFKKKTDKNRPSINPKQGSSELGDGASASAPSLANGSIRRNQYFRWGQQLGILFVIGSLVLATSWYALGQHTSRPQQHNGLMALKIVRAPPQKLVSLDTLAVHKNNASVIQNTINQEQTKLEQLTSQLTEIDNIASEINTIHNRESQITTLQKKLTATNTKSVEERLAHLKRYPVVLPSIREELPNLTTDLTQEQNRFKPEVRANIIGFLRDFDSRKFAYHLTDKHVGSITTFDSLSESQQTYVIGILKTTPPAMSMFYVIKDKVYGFYPVVKVTTSAEIAQLSQVLVEITNQRLEIQRNIENLEKDLAFHREKVEPTKTKLTLGDPINVLRLTSLRSQTESDIEAVHKKVTALRTVQKNEQTLSNPLNHQTETDKQAAVETHLRNLEIAAEALAKLPEAEYQKALQENLREQQEIKEQLRTPARPLETISEDQSTSSSLTKAQAQQVWDWGLFIFRGTLVLAVLGTFNYVFNSVLKTRKKRKSQVRFVRITAAAPVQEEAPAATKNQKVVTPWQKSRADITGTVIVRDNGIERVQYVSDDVAHQVRYRYRKDGKLGRMTTTTVSNLSGRTTKQSLRYQYEGDQLVGFTDRNRSFIADFPKKDQRGRPLVMIVKNQLKEVRALVQVDYQKNGNVELKIFFSGPKHENLYDRMNSGDLPDELKRFYFNGNIDLKMLRRRIFNMSMKGVDAVQGSAVPGTQTGTYKDFDEQGRPNRLVVKEETSAGLVTKLIVLISYLENGEVREEIYRSRDVEVVTDSGAKGYRASAEELVADKFPADEVRLFAKPPFSENLTARTVKQVEVRKFAKDGRTIKTQSQRSYDLEEVPVEGNAAEDVESNDEHDHDEDDLDSPHPDMVQIQNGHAVVVPDVSAAVEPEEQDQENSDNSKPSNGSAIEHRELEQTAVKVSETPKTAEESAEQSKDLNQQLESAKQNLTSAIELVQSLRSKAASISKHRLTVSVQKVVLPVRFQVEMSRVRSSDRSSVIAFARDLKENRYRYAVLAKHLQHVQRVRDLTTDQRVQFRRQLTDAKADDYVIVYKGQLYGLDPIVEIQNRDTELKLTLRQAYLASKEVEALKIEIADLEHAIILKNRLSLKAWLAQPFLFVKQFSWVQYWARSAEIIRTFYVFNDDGVSLYDAAVNEESAIHNGTLDRWTWLIQNHGQGVPRIFLAGLTVAILIAKVGTSVVLFAIPSTRQRASLAIAVQIHSLFSVFWRLVLKPIEITGKTILFEASRAMGPKRNSWLKYGLEFLVVMPWFLPASGDDYRAQTSRKELKFGIPEGPAVDKVIKTLYAMGMQPDKIFWEKQNIYSLGYPVTSAYEDDEEWRLAFERENLMSARVKPRQRQYEVDDERIWLEIKNTEVIARKKKRLEVNRRLKIDIDGKAVDVTPSELKSGKYPLDRVYDQTLRDLQKGVYDPSILKDPTDLKQQQYLKEWLTITRRTRRRILIRYWRMAFEEPEREGAQSAAGLRINLDFGVSYKKFDDRLHGGDIVGDTEGFNMTYHGFLKQNTGTRIFEIKFPGLRPPMWVLELVRSINETSPDQVVWGGYSKYADSVLRMEGLKPGDKRLRGPGLPFSEFIRQNPHFVYKNPDGERRQRPDSYSDFGDERIIGFYDDAFDDPYRERLRQKEAKDKKNIIRADVPMEPGFLKGAFVRSSNGFDRKSKVEETAAQPFPDLVAAPSPLRGWRLPLWFAKETFSNVILFLLPFGLCFLWIAFSAPSLSMTDVMGAAFMRHGNKIDNINFAIVTIGAYLAASAWAWVYDKTHVKEDYNPDYPDGIRLIAPFMAFVFLFLQQSLLLGLVLTSAVSIFGIRGNNRAPADSIAIGGGIVLGFTASLTSDLDSWLWTVLVLMIMSLGRFMNYWSLRYHRNRPNDKYDALLRLTYIGSDTEADTAILEEVLQKYVKRRTDFIVPLKNSPLRGSLEFDLIDPAGIDPVYGGVRGFRKALKEHLDGKFEFTVYNKRGTIRSWYGNRILFLTLAFLGSSVPAFAGGMAVVAAQPLGVQNLVVPIVIFALGVRALQRKRLSRRDEQKRVASVVSQMERLVQEIRSRNRLDATDLNSLLGRVENQGLNQPSRVVGPSLRTEDKVIIQSALRQMLNADRSEKLTLRDVQNLLKNQLIDSNSVQSIKLLTTSQSEELPQTFILPVSAQDHVLISKLLDEMPVAHLILIADEDADFSSFKTSERVQVLHFGELVQGSIFVHSATGRALKMDVLATVLKTIPINIRSKAHVELPSDVELLAPIGFDVTQSIIADFDWAFIDQNLNVAAVSLNALTLIAGSARLFATQA